MPTDSSPGRSLVTRRAIADVVRGATLGSYGVTGFAAGPIERLLAAVGLAQPGLRLHLGAGLQIELRLTVAYGLPVAEVARQVDSAVRYAVRRSLGREIDRLTIHVGGLRYSPGGLPPLPAHRDPQPVATADLADSGTDVA
ncbi:MAG TPA: Asp23/Gls24 family envelope stress response protein [Candidatus Limnocylindrales bacterium]|nr:Asp23/Gls24 family envelope stress response protein [Candidatus Limnocylindrales bacterium]